MTSVAILGSTGSVGCSTLDVIRMAGGAFRVDALTAATNIEALVSQAREFQPRFVAVADETKLAALREALGGLPVVSGAGESALLEAASAADTVVAAIVGAAGLKPTLAAARRGARLALANKECLVSAGALFTAACRDSECAMLPVDSEHSAIFQLLEGARAEDVARITLTASGGPFRDWLPADIAHVRPADALRHPTWEMGAKITIDSATLMNKGLELIEASVLFGVGDDRLDVLVHPQSIVHGLVEFTDGALTAHMGAPDMKGPIAYALSWPRRQAGVVAPLDLAKIASLSFEPPNYERFPALGLARSALRRGGRAPAVLNAANEIAVAAFLDRQIGFPDIAAIVDETLEASSGRSEFGQAPDSLDAVLETDVQARSAARAAIQRRI